MSIFEWAMLGGLGLAAMIFCARIMRRGITTYDDNRKRIMDKIQEDQRLLETDRKKIPSQEHFEVLRAALEDYMRLENAPSGWSIVQNGQLLQLHTPKGDWELKLESGEKKRRHAQAPQPQGNGRFILAGSGHYECHTDLASLMRSLNGHLHPVDEIEPEPEHLARRLAGTRQSFLYH